ncbi:velvet factor-domain-containing protein [Colletotrichum navitas]|uniref:Velvet factor-domain-containing protein n=1 Tax=Colletotrichum navitas TaxID=681940 RepID=A0AAD8PXE4_9PEZI|nr:velvet factor-domain-containing protein [Colletotrichum navitas]KAK1589835.1 velvet factor-domain-containing protein [Colletotrichum navitas]
MSYSHNHLGGSLPTQQRFPTSHSGISLTVVQGPTNAKVATGKEKDRKPIDPPPIVRLNVEPRNFDRNFYGNPDNCLFNPFWIMYVYLINADRDSKQDPEVARKALVGTTCSSLHKFKDPNSHDAGYFVFGDLSVKYEGCFKLQFVLYEMRRTEVVMCTTATSSAFQVHTQRTFPGMAESTYLTRHLSDQGCRLRLRKDSRQATNRKRQLTFSLEAERARTTGPSPKRHRGDGSGDALHDGIQTHTGLQTSSAGSGGYVGGFAQHQYQSPYQSSRQLSSSRQMSRNRPAPPAMAVTPNYTTAPLLSSYTTAPIAPNFTTASMGSTLPATSMGTQSMGQWPATPSSGLSAAASLPSASPTQSPPDMVHPNSYYRLDSSLIFTGDTSTYEGEDALPDEIFTRDYPKDSFWAMTEERRRAGHGTGNIGA